jgi:hypothetical protein
LNPKARKSTAKAPRRKGFAKKGKDKQGFPLRALRALASLRWGLIPIFRINAVPTSRALKVHHQDTKAQRFRQERQKTRLLPLRALRALASLRWGLIPIFRINAVPTSRALESPPPRHQGTKVSPRKAKKQGFYLCAPSRLGVFAVGVDSDFQD